MTARTLALFGTGVVLGALVLETAMGTSQNDMDQILRKVPNGKVCTRLAPHLEILPDDKQALFPSMSFTDSADARCQETYNSNRIYDCLIEFFSDVTKCVNALMTAGYTVRELDGADLDYLREEVYTRSMIPLLLQSPLRFERGENDYLKALEWIVSMAHQFTAYEWSRFIQSVINSKLVAEHQPNKLSRRIEIVISKLRRMYEASQDHAAFIELLSAFVLAGDAKAFLDFAKIIETPLKAQEQVSARHNSVSLAIELQSWDVLHVMLQDLKWSLHSLTHDRIKAILLSNLPLEDIQLLVPLGRSFKGWNTVLAPMVLLNLLAEDHNGVDIPDDCSRIVTSLAQDFVDRLSVLDPLFKDRLEEYLKSAVLLKLPAVVIGLLQNGAVPTAQIRQLALRICPQCARVMPY